MQPSLINAIINRLRGKTSPTDNANIDKELMEHFQREDWPSIYEDSERIKERIFQGVDEKLNQSSKPLRRTIRLAPMLKIAAVIAVFLFIGLQLFKYETQNSLSNLSITAQAKPMLGLSSNLGDYLDLAQMKVGEEYKTANFSLHKVDELHYEYFPSQTYSANLKLTIATGNNQINFIRLADGSQVVLNKNSVLAFPSHFDAHQRKIEASGELYFEVAKKLNQPFTVLSQDLIAEVKGTSFVFNSNSSSKKPFIALIEGSLEMKAKDHAVLLKPGEKGNVQEDGLQITTFDQEEALAFTKNQFLFINEPISDIMEEIASWYNVKLTMVGKNWKNTRYTVRMKKDISLERAIDILELTGAIKIQQTEGRIIVKKK